LGAFFLPHKIKSMKLAEPITKTTNKMELDNNPLNINYDKLIMAGPCSVESEEQIMAIAKEIAKNKSVHVIRGGVWKPRTRPNTFEGHGRPAAQWLKKAGEAVGLPVATEVANAKHVYEALDAGIDILWLGARTVVNPFAVQEIADALEGKDVPVLVKNPINPDLELWIGAIERLHKAGLTRIMAIHRGFSQSGRSKYRNKPNWHIPIELKRRLPSIQVICDPSHIGGTRDLIQKISQSAIDLNFEGLMIETHMDPDNAMSDAKQQITPDRLIGVLSDLIHRESKDDTAGMDLDDMRESIDQIDNELIELLGQRMEVVKNIAQYKKANQVTIYQANRWDAIMAARLEAGNTKELSEKFINKLFQSIHNESIEKQSKIMNS